MSKETKPRFAVETVEYTQSSFPYAIKEEGEVIATFPTLGEANRKCNELLEIFQESLILEAEAEAELEFDDPAAETSEATDADVAAEAPTDEEVLEVDEDPDGVTQDEIAAQNVADGFIYLAEHKKYAPAFIKPEVTPEETTAWANEVLTSEKATSELASKLVMSIEDIGSTKGVKSWLNSVISMAGEITEILKDSINVFTGLSQEAPEEEEPVEDTPAEEPAADGEPAAEESEATDEAATDDDETDAELEALFA